MLLEFATINQPGAVTILAAEVSSDVEANVARVITEANADPALRWVDVPRLPTQEQALQWIRESGWQMWLVEVDGKPAGYIGLHGLEDDTESPQGFENHLISDSFLLEEYRGKRVISRAWEALLRSVPEETRFLAEIWEDNHRSIRRVERDGWCYVGDVFYGSPEGTNESGWCKRYTLSVSEAVN